MLGTMEDYGRLGNDNTSDSLVPVNVHTSSTDSAPLSDIAQISSGSVFTPALSPNDGEVKCWGPWNLQWTIGQWGIYNILTQYSRFGLRTGKNGSRNEATCPTLSNVAAITSYSSTTCALTDSGTVKCWGYGTNGGFGQWGRFFIAIFL